MPFGGGGVAGSSFIFRVPNRFNRELEQISQRFNSIRFLLKIDFSLFQEVDDGSQKVSSPVDRAIAAEY
jgi:hypothetical protein